MNIYTTALLISRILVVSTIISTRVIASDIHTAPYHLKPSDINVIHIPSVIRPFNNQFFLYDLDAIQFDLDSYLRTNMPEFIDKKELITHWSGYYSINPKIILTLMEMQSQIISLPTDKALDRPFGSLSNQQNFDAQLQDILAQLSQRFYAYEEFQLQNKPQSSEAINAASFALLGLLNQDVNKRERFKPESLLELDRFIEQLSLLFGHQQDELQLLLSNNKTVANSQSTKGKQPKQQNIPPQDMLQMPWRIDYSWKSNGAHSHTGSGYPLSSIDVSYNWPRWGQRTYSVASAHNGTVNVLSRCQVRVTNSNGWATNYYHMDSLSVSNGQYVDANTVLGVYASNRNVALCQGGSSTGPHLHFSLLKNGRHMSLQDVQFSHYTINVGRSNYDDNCNRFNLYDLDNNRTVCAWTPLYNSGN
ncbi:M23 family metallopeptidase [Shewanella sp. VB17]|uniref:M23 family metallopeptidase n=1 Tax=Shewanella sp. VB17 TaxID=2739432 RepID=UPI00156754D2|nr:M23 family metallopeptidase [Shewanella sp. VB17]NRD72431.1 M23 family metallopeptidase [Shewanella sp. VB17]